MSIFDEMPRQQIKFRKSTGDVLGPYDATLTGGYTIVWDQMANIDAGDTMLQTMPSGKVTEHVVDTVNFMPSMDRDIPAHFQVTFGSPRNATSQLPGTNTFHFHGSQTIAVGNHNTQTVLNFVEAMKKQIEESDASESEKTEALTLLEKFTANPIVSGVISSAAWTGISEILG